MSYWIEVCKNNPDRKTKMERLELLSQLPGDEGVENETMLEGVRDEIRKESHELLRKFPVLDSYFGSSPYSLRFDCKELCIHFDICEYLGLKRAEGFYAKPKDQSDVLSTLQRIKTILTNSTEIEWADILISFFKTVVENDLIIFTV